MSVPQSYYAENTKTILMLRNDAEKIAVAIEPPGPGKENGLGDEAAPDNLRDGRRSGAEPVADEE